MIEICGDVIGWWELNIVYYLVRIVRDLGVMFGIEFEEDVVVEYLE